MKIGIVSPYYMHLYGGVQTLILDMSRHLQQRGHQVTIIAPQPPGRAAQAPVSKEVVKLGNSIHVNFKNPFRTTFPLAASDRRVIADFLLQEQFDVLNIHEPWMPLFAYQILQEANCPVIGTTHARWPRSQFNKSLETIRAPYLRTVAQKVDQMTAVSTVAALNVTNLKIDVDVQIIPNGIDLKRYKEATEKYHRPDSPPFILYLNRLDKQKGAPYLLEAYAQYRRLTQKPPLPLVIAGQGPQARILKRNARLLNLQEFISFEGFVSEERKHDLLANAHLYVTPAPYGETFGIVLLEAMASQTPFIAGDNEGYRVVAQGKGSISLIDPRRADRFAQLIDLFCNNQQLRREWLQWSNEAILQYDFPHIIDQYEACFLKHTSDQQ